MERNKIGDFTTSVSKSFEFWSKRWCVCLLFYRPHGELIGWKTIESLYLSETTTSTMGVRLCHKHHVWLTSHNRMRVYLAAGSFVPVFLPWHSLEYMNRDTELFIRIVDQFFDYLNVKNSKLCDAGHRIRTHEMSAWRYCVLKCSIYLQLPTFQWLSGYFIDDWDQPAELNWPRAKDKKCV